jgi:ABC-type multidrug transport system fused ATPase/permease subunit
MERVEIKTSLTLADWQAYQRNWAQRNLGQGIQIGTALIGAAIVFAALVLSRYLHRPLSMPSVIVGILFVTAASYFTAMRA